MYVCLSLVYVFAFCVCVCVHVKLVYVFVYVRTHACMSHLLRRSELHRKSKSTDRLVSLCTVALRELPTGRIHSKVSSAEQSRGSRHTLLIRYAYFEDAMRRYY